MNLDMVRSGIITYGLYPSDEVDCTKLDLMPAMEFKTHVVKINEVPEGEGVSYGATYVTKSLHELLQYQLAMLTVIREAFPTRAELL